MSAAMVGRIGDALVVLLRHFRPETSLAGEGKRLAVLLHGFPPTWWAWRHVIPKLADAGFRGWLRTAEVPVTRHTLRPATTSVALVGHDIGIMVADACCEKVTHLAVVDAPLPGTAVFERMRVDPGSGSSPFTAFGIFRVPIAGRERLYSQAMIGARIFDPSAISKSDLDIYIGLRHAGRDARRARGLPGVRPRYRRQQGGARGVRQADGACARHRRRDQHPRAGDG